MPECNAHAHARTHTLDSRRRRTRPTASPRRGNPPQPGTSGNACQRIVLAPPPGEVARSEEKCKKVAKSFGDSEKIRNFAAMNEPKFIITGINQLTHLREQLSRPMTEQDASERLQREVANRKFQRHAAHTRLKMERLDAVQLTIHFNDHEE